MRHRIDTYVLPLAFAQVVSFEELAVRSDPEGDPPSFDYPDPTPGPDEQLMCAEVCAAVDVFVRGLSLRHQEIVRRLFWMDETQADVARQLGVSKMAISKTMSRISKLGRAALAAHQNLALMN